MEYGSCALLRLASPEEGKECRREKGLEALPFSTANFGSWDLHTVNKRKNAF